MDDNAIPPDPQVPPRPALPPSEDDQPLANQAKAQASDAVSDAGAAVSSGASAVSGVWSRLDQTGRMIAGGSIAAIVILIVGLPAGAWDSTDFALIMLVATIILAVTAWSAGSRQAAAVPMRVPMPVVQVTLGTVAAVLAVWNLLEVLFDLDDMRGGVVGFVLAVALAVAAVAILVGTVRQAGGTEALGKRDMWSRITLGGLVLVLVGWALNLTVGYWTMSAATLSLGALTLAALIIVHASKVTSPISVAWIGVILGVFAAWIAIGLWSELAELGEDRVDLSVIDIGAFLLYVVGILLIAGGGVLTALELGAKNGPSVTSGPPTIADGAPPTAS